jgi:LysR family glycine cleavage system transcriptional activator
MMALRAFEAAGRHANFARAADDLHITAAAVSQQVRNLERDVGVALFLRRARGVELTAAGAQYARTLGTLLDQLALATERVTETGQTNRLTIATTPAFAARWLMPRLISFLERHPTLDVRLSTSNSIVDFARQEIDIAVRYGSGRWPGLEAQLLAGTELLPVCSPSFRRRYPALRVPADVRPRTLLRLTVDEWPRWFEAAGLAGRRAQGPEYSDAGLLTQAAIAGQGIALGQSLIIADDLAAGRLVEVFKLRIRSISAYYLVAPPGAFISPRVLTFCRWLRTELDGKTSVSPERYQVTDAEGSR